MALLYVTEYEALSPTTEGGAAQVPRTPPVVDQVPVVVGGTSLQSAAFGKTTTFVRLNCDVTCSIAFGPNPTATANSQRLAANQTEYFGVTRGYKVAVITNV